LYVIRAMALNYADCYTHKVDCNVLFCKPGWTEAQPADRRAIQMYMIEKPEIFIAGFSGMN